MILIGRLEMTLDPNCLKKNKKFGWTARGYLLPCCWCDVPSTYAGKQGAVSKLIQDKFHIDNIENFQEVVDSPEWKELYDILTNNARQNDVPQVCKRHCGQGKKSKREFIVG